MNNPPQSHDEIRQLFKKHAPQVAAGVVELVSIAREPGKLLMVAVRSRDEAIDAVASCIGTRGIYMKTILRELGGKITIVRWSDSPETFIRSSLSPHNPTVTSDDSRHRAVLKVDQKTMEELTAENNLKLRLTSELVGWEIELMNGE